MQVPLLIIASWEWDGGSGTWIAGEDRTDPSPPPLGARDGNFTLIDIVGGYNLQLHACPADPSHPHIELRRRARHNRHRDRLSSSAALANYQMIQTMGPRPQLRSTCRSDQASDLSAAAPIRARKPPDCTQSSLW